MREYPVFFKDKCVGNAKAQQQGLYWHILCRCHLVSDGFMRLEVSDGKNTRDLGVLIPDADAFVVDTRINAGGMDFKEISFQVLRQGRDEVFVPIKPEDAFSYLDKLRQARFDKRDGVCGVVIPADSDNNIKDQFRDPQGNDQNP